MPIVTFQHDELLSEEWLNKDGERQWISVIEVTEEDGVTVNYYLPINVLCEIFWLDTRFWQESLREDDVSGPHCRPLPYAPPVLPGESTQRTGGTQPTWCLHSGMVGYFLGWIGHSKRINPTAKVRLLPFRLLSAKLEEMALRGEFDHLGSSLDLSALVPANTRRASHAAGMALLPGRGHDKRISDTEGLVLLLNKRIGDAEAEIAELREQVAAVKAGQNGRKHS